MSGEELKQKFLGMVAPVFAPKQAEKIMELVEDFENLDDVRRLIKALTLDQYTK